MANTILIKSKTDGVGVPTHGAGLKVAELAVNTSNTTGGNRGHVFMGVTAESATNLTAGTNTASAYNADGSQDGGIVWVGAPILNEDDMASNDDTKLATQQSIKAYVDDTVAGADTLAEMSDTNISSPASAELLIYDGSNSWDNIAMSGEASISSAGAVTISNNVIDEANMKISNGPTNGYVLTAQSGNTGGMTWAEVSGLSGLGSTDNRMVRTNGTAGTAAQNTGITVDDSDNMSGIGTISAGVITATGFTIGSAAILEAELEILDGANVTTAELNIMDGGTSATSTTVVDADRVVMNDNGTMVQVAVTDLAAYFDDEITAMPNLVTTAATTVGTLASGAISSGFGAIDNGSSTLDTGALTATTGTFVGDMSFTSDTATFASTNSTDPLVQIKNTTNDAAGSRLRFVKDKGAAGADGDDIGLIEFYSDNDAEQQTLFAKVTAEVADASDGTEGGKLSLGVATHDGEFQNGIVLTDGSAEDEIDITIGSGSSSVTTINGDLTVSGTTTTVNSTTLSVADDLITCSKGNDTVANADGSGLEIDATGATNLYWKYVHANTAWQSNVDIDTSATGNVYKINGTEVLGPTTLGSGVVTSSLTTVGALNSGSITSGFGTIDTGSSAITTTGLGTFGSLDVDDVVINGTTIGHTDDTDLITLANGIATVAGEISVTTLDIGGTNVAATAAELNIMDGGTSASSTTLADADRVVVNDNGTMKQVALTDFEVYMESSLDTLNSVTSASSLATVGTITSGTWQGTAVALGYGGTGLVGATDGKIVVADGSGAPVHLDVGSSTAITIVGALASGSIASGFGAINNGASAITTSGTMTCGTLTDGTATLTGGALSSATIDCGGYTAA